METSVLDEVKTTVDQLIRVLSTKNIVGEPIDMGDRIIIPVTRVGLAFGAGAGETKGGQAGGSGGGTGGAAGVTPVAAIVFYKNIPGPEGVKVLPLAPYGQLGKALGEIVSTVAEKMGRERPKGTEKASAGTA